MGNPTELSGRDETLASGLYTGLAATTTPRVYLARFEYTIRRNMSLSKALDRVSAPLARELSPEHRALLERGEEQSPEDIALASRMLEVQRDALAR